MKTLSLFCAIILSTLAVSVNAQLKTGTWRGALKTASGNVLPFNFIVKDTAGKQQ